MTPSLCVFASRLGPRTFLVTLTLTMLVACGGSPPVQPQIPGAPGITCPANIDLLSVDGNPVTVSFAPPATTNGSPPVTTSCTPASDTAFSTGQTLVNCAATDAIGRSATCAFLVTVTSAPQLSVSQFLAFGDSMTAGEIAFNLRLIVDPSRSYPADLSTLLRNRYSRQTITVVNEGQSGETAVEGSLRISRVLERAHPQVILILEGVNDLNQGRDAAINTVIEALKFDIRDAQRRNVQVMLSTLLPQKPGFRAQSIDLVEDANDRIRDLAAREHVILVDSWQAFKGREATLIGDDGLHPTPEGYQVLAETFFEMIRSTYEIPPAASIR